ncbi:PEP-CTERM sorting domain-containing protein [Thalassotalea sp. PLHSN55]|uniref:PEP-CTERM sorting domain-containing protein n=1 Tax=Thalassotalea sp. PLHSN55 TaxID=3435888 RepID=UPI003F869B65
MKNIIKSSLFLVLSFIGLQANAGLIPSGIQTNVDKNTVNNTWNWSECASFPSFMTVDFTSTIAGCSGDHLAMAIYQDGSDDYAIFAGAAYNDVLLETDAGSHVANGVQWYFNADSFPWSWGFTEVGATTNRNNCDVNLLFNNNLGMCWHTGVNAVSGGWAFNNGSFNYLDSSFTRVLLTTNASSVPEPSSLLIFALGIIGLASRRFAKR